MDEIPTHPKNCRSLTKKKQAQLSSWNFVTFKIPSRRKKREGKAKIFPKLQRPNLLRQGCVPGAVDWGCPIPKMGNSWEFPKEMGIQESGHKPDKDWDINETLQRSCHNPQWALHLPNKVEILGMLQLDIFQGVYKV